MSAAAFTAAGLFWIYVSAELEEAKAVSGNTRHFLKVASPGFASIIIGIGMMILEVER